MTKDGGIGLLGAYPDTGIEVGALFGGLYTGTRFGTSTGPNNAAYQLNFDASRNAPTGLENSPRTLPMRIYRRVT